MADKLRLRQAYGAMPGFNETNPRWHDYMRSVTEWYESLGYPGFNPLLPRARARSPSPRRLMKRSRSRSAGSGHKKKRSMSPETREYDARGRETARRSRSRDSASRRYVSTDKVSRSLKLSNKSHSSKQDPRLDSRTSHGSRVEKLKGKAAKSTEPSAKEKAVKKGMQSKPRDVGKPRDIGMQPRDIGTQPRDIGTHKLQKPVDIGLKQPESVQPPSLVENRQLSYKANVEGKPSVETRKLITIPIPSIFDLSLTGRYPRPVVEPPHFRKVIAEPLYKKELTTAADQKPVSSSSQQLRSHLKVETDKTVLAASEKAIETAPQTPPTVEREKEKVDVQPAVLPASPVVESVVEKPITEAEPETEDKPEMPPPVSDECSETVTKPESVAAEETAVQRVMSDKTEVSVAKNIAEVKPLLVASIPEKSRWEREGEVSYSRDLPMYPPRDRDRPTVVKTSLPR